MLMVETIQAEGDVNARLLKALHDARDEIAALRVEVDKLCAPPFTYGVYLAAHEDDTVDVLAHGRKVRVRLHQAIPARSLRPGQEVILNEALNVVAAAGWERQRAVIALHAEGERIAVIADPLRATRLRPGDQLLMDPRSGYLLERLPTTGVDDLALEEVPDVDYGDVGGLEAQIRAIEDAVE